jgi:mycofactocin system transcriptional regulator
MERQIGCILVAGQTTGRGNRGRPIVTSHAEIERQAFELFAEHGFAGTTMADIARAVGVGTRTVFRYYASKNDIPWGQFDETLTNFRVLLEGQPPDLAVHEAVHRAVVEFNRFPPGAEPSHRERMRLILQTPELQAHSVLKYAEWRHVIADFVAERLGQKSNDWMPLAAGHVSLALALTAYERWLDDPDADIVEAVDTSMESLKQYLGATS